MWPEPDNPDVIARMRTAHALARAALDVLPAANTHEAWGWHGRTLSQPVTTPHGPAWLRVACAPSGQVAATFWDGSIEAEKAMPASVPRPRLRRWHDWNGRVAVDPDGSLGGVTHLPEPGAQAGQEDDGRQNYYIGRVRAPGTCRIGWRQHVLPRRAVP